MKHRVYTQGIVHYNINEDRKSVTYNDTSLCEKTLYLSRLDCKYVDKHIDTLKKIQVHLDISPNNNIMIAPRIRGRLALRPSLT